MPNTQSTVDASGCLDELDVDIPLEFNTILDITKTVREKYSLLLACARKLESTLAAKQEELDEAQTALIVKQTELNTIRIQLQGEVSIQTEAGAKALVKLRSANRKLKRERGRSAHLYRRNEHLMDQNRWANEQAKLLAPLSADLRALQEELELVDHLRCEICVEKFKGAVTRCGHGFCSECLQTWMQCAREDAGESDQRGDRGRYTCPSCRSSLKANQDVWPIYLGDKDTATEIISIDSDGD